MNKNLKNGFNEAMKYLNTYYGQLAFVEINHGKKFALQEQKKLIKNMKKNLKKSFNKKYTSNERIE